VAQVTAAMSDGGFELSRCLSQAFTGVLCLMEDQVKSTFVVDQRAFAHL
jgi:hypothetical protein